MSNYTSKFKAIKCIMYPLKSNLGTHVLNSFQKVSIGCLLLLTFATCDFNVTNPGAIQDEQLNEPGSFEAIVNGMGRDLAEAINWIGYTGGAVAREIHPSGSTASFGISVRWQRGILDPDETNTHWDNAQQARWVAEAGIERLRENMTESEFSSSEVVAQAYLWAGYSNRLLGENMCECIIDGGPAEDIDVFFQRAEEHFTNALQIAQSAGNVEYENAALAGRSSVRVALENWEGAVSDADQIPMDFVYEIPYFDIEQDQYNRIYHSSANDPYRAHTVWQTQFEDYYLEYEDPRTPWGQNPDIPVGDAAVGGLGSVVWYYQLKHDSKSSPIRLSSGHEMVLIKAESLLLDGSWQEAMALINSLRSEVGVDPWEASSLEEAWSFLKRERAIELWLEARRLGDLKRWEENGTPGELQPLERPNDPSQELPLDADRDLCFPIPESELDTNPNL